MRTIVKAAIAAGFFCWAFFATGPLMAQGPYCYFDPNYNSTVCIPNHIYYTPKRYFPFYGPAYLAIQLAIRSMECVVPLVSFFRSSFRTAYAERLAGSLTPAASRRPGLSRNWARLKTVR